MACHEKSFSTYQREAIKKVKALVNETPFSYEKSANNHLQIKIDGIDRVFYTASTPSDSRSLDNFIGDIRAEINRIKAQAREPITPLEQPKSKGKADARKAAQVFMDTVTDKVHKKLQRKLQHIEKEEYHVFKTTENDNPGNAVREFRKKLIRNEVERAVKAGKGTLFIPPGLNRASQAQLEDYLSNALPALPEYHNKMQFELNQKLAQQTQPAFDIPVTDSQPVAVSIPEPAVASAPAEPLAQAPTAHKDMPSGKHSSKHETATTIESEPLFNDLLSAKPHKRIAMLKALPKQKIALLIEDCQKALQQKHQDDIDFLAEQMRSRGISLSELQDALK